MPVEITEDEGELRPGNPAVLFEGDYLGSTPIRSWDVTPDGQRFLMIRWNRDEEQARQEQYFGNKVNVVQNWFEELKRLVPAGE